MSNEDRESALVDVGWQPPFNDGIMTVFCRESGGSSLVVGEVKGEELGLEPVYQGATAQRVACIGSITITGKPRDSDAQRLDSGAFDSFTFYVQIPLHLADHTSLWIITLSTSASTRPVQLAITYSMPK